MGWIQYSSTYFQMRVGSFDHVPLCQAPKAATSRGPGASNAYLLLEAPRYV
jgi:hypothetical protein